MGNGVGLVNVRKVLLDGRDHRVRSAVVVMLLVVMLMVMTMRDNGE